MALRDALAAANESLRSALAMYWPNEGANEISESNLSTHLAIALASRGFHVFTEAPVAGTDQRIDLFAFGPTRETAILFEAKRLYQHEKAAEVAADWRRLADARLPSQYGDGGLAHAEVLRCVAATTWKRDVHAFWIAADRAALAPGIGAGWRALDEALASAAEVGALEIQRDPEWGTQWLLYAFGARQTHLFQHGA